MTDDRERADRRIVLVRHAQTEWSLSGRHTGKTDLPLTAAGRALTNHLRQRLAGQRFGRVLTSPLRRAVETCEIAGFAAAAEHSADLVEWDYGTYEGRTTRDIREGSPGWDLWRDGAPGGESPSDVASRLDRVVVSLVGSSRSGHDVIVFGHGHALTALTLRWLDLPLAHGRHFQLDTGSVSTLGWKREVRVLRNWNDQNHLPAT